jgi:adenosylhomocysteine nucleosidase
MTVAVICAMDWEMAHLRQALPQSTEPLILEVSGMGMASAAAKTQAVIAQYAPRAVVNYGCAGAHRADLLLGDLVVATQVVAYEHLEVQTVASDGALLAAAHRAAEALLDRHEAWPLELGWPDGVPHRSPRVNFGTVASADRWNRSACAIEALAARYDSLCEDMEAAAIGLVCAREKVAFIAVKDISNNELLRPTTSGSAMLSELGVNQLARRAAAFTLELLLTLASTTSG